ncbi:hypothetical protein JVT61DRAFT_8677 [Boletus reticuloceps]|uniref:2-oxoacid dehydrogenase acyltransferase catalytic domain-containing protein n=1 Tax=Boletus reticuloceps TaxID=495285 RepID=A0A8I3ACN0_9AGAM|nr:hypothetical protein JVT61DRAFT_12282 [Boletus reticuloceps]KAG6380513.1 hypothetical protein JVT61DRAFT_8677 [Boletus reticuloceps]
MVVALVYDHRLLDGREAITFLDLPMYRLLSYPTLTVASAVKVRNYIEDPRKMLLAPF